MLLKVAQTTSKITPLRNTRLGRRASRHQARTDLFQFEGEPLSIGELVLLQVGHQLTAVLVGVGVQFVERAVGVELLLVQLRGERRVD